VKTIENRHKKKQEKMKESGGRNRENVSGKNSPYFDNGVNSLKKT
jgi:hypothetical protein